MVNKCGLTEKRMKDKRFRRTEEAFFKIVLVSGDYINIEKIVRETGISRTTFYRHHTAPQKIVDDYEEFVLDYSCRMMRDNKRMNTKVVFYQTIVFIMKHKSVIDLVIHRDGERLLREMMVEVLPRIAIEYRFSNRCNKMKEVYVGELVGILRAWGKERFCDQQKEKVFSDLMFLTSTVRERLEPLN